MNLIFFPIWLRHHTTLFLIKYIVKWHGDSWILDEKNARENNTHNHELIIKNKQHII